MNFIPCTAWVKRGVAASNPEKVELTPEELEAVIEEARTKLQDDEGSEAEEENAKSNEIEEITMSGGDEYNFDKYDEEDDTLQWNIASLMSLQKDGNPVKIKEEDEDSEKEDDLIKPDDNLVLIGRVEGDACVLEVFVYNESEESFYCHHDMILPSFPLCIEWLNYDPTHTEPGNYCAIGSMSPIIEVWDLDIVDCLEPAYRLGSKGSKKKKESQVGHTDAVLDITWNKNYAHVLASGSVDQTVLLWDLENCVPVTKLDSFNEKVQALQWHPKEAHQLLTGCADKFVRLFDCREKNSTKQWQLDGEIERVLWNHFKPNYCFASTDNGHITCIDIRKDEPIWTTQAHEKEVTGLSLSSSRSNLLVTCSNDGIIKAWEVVKKQEPECLWQKKMALGALQCLASNPDNPFLFSVGGDNKRHNFEIIDFSRNRAVYNRIMGIASTENGDDKSEKMHAEGEPSEMMDVTEEMESMGLNTKSSTETGEKKRKFKKKHNAQKLAA